MNTTQTLDKLVVTRDGNIDDDYYDQLYTLKRKAALKQAGRKAVQGTMTAAISISKNIVNLLRALPEQVNQV